LGSADKHASRVCNDLSPLRRKFGLEDSSSAELPLRRTPSRIDAPGYRAKIKLMHPALHNPSSHRSNSHGLMPFCWLICLAVLSGLSASAQNGRAQTSGNISDSNITGVYTGNYRLHDDNHSPQFSLAIFEADDGALLAL
jgi:hypothetical protein